MACQIEASVGEGGANRKKDVRNIQKALNTLYPKVKLTLDGLIGPATIRKIKAFQKTFMRQPDGRIDPGGRSLGKLNERLDAKKSTEPAAASTNVSPKAENTKTRKITWTGDSARWSQEKKLKSLRPDFRTKVEKMLEELDQRGFQPKVFYGWRSVAVQKELYDKGRSKVTFSFHNAQHPDGTPCSCAVDIIDKRWAWGAAAMKNGFWEALGEAARKQNCVWGGDWKSFKDWAHVQSFPNNQLGRIKRESGLA